MSHPVFIIENPRTLHFIAPHVAHYKERVQFIVSPYLGLYQFNYPRGLPRSHYPFVTDPKWKPRSAGNNVYEAILHHDEVCVSPAPRASYHEIIKNASQIYFACELDHSGVSSFHVLLEQVLGAQEAMEEYPVIQIDYTEKTLIQSIKDPSNTNQTRFTSLRNAGLAKQFFDYNYNSNALALFSPLLKELTGNPHSVISKYGLQTLLFLRETKEAYTTAQLMTLMPQWRGTGRYPQGEMGSSRSRYPIIEGLLNLGLLEQKEPLDALHVSQRGHELLKRIHPDCLDLDLPFRLARWQADWPQSRPVIQRYLNTFFGKQKRFT